MAPGLASENPGDQRVEAHALIRGNADKVAVNGRSYADYELAAVVLFTSRERDRALRLKRGSDPQLSGLLYRAKRFL